MSAADPIGLLAPLAGRWAGPSRLWFEPGKLADEARLEGDFVLLHGGKFADFVYRTTVQGKPAEGRYTFGYHPARSRWEMNWFDSFHMSRGQLFCFGPSNGTGFDALGHYPDGVGGPDWGWRTEFRVPGPDALVLTAFNIEPSGEEQMATQLQLERVR